MCLGKVSSSYSTSSDIESIYTKQQNGPLGKQQKQKNKQTNKQKQKQAKNKTKTKQNTKSKKESKAKQDTMTASPETNLSIIRAF